jgi:hypothetical protein
MFGKIFESLFTGSMVGAGPTVFAVWSYVIAYTKPPGVVELNPRLLAVIIGCEVGEVEKAIDYLTSPDPMSRFKEHEGRRLIRCGSFAYEVPTWSTYRAIKSAEDRKAANAEAQRRYREKQRAARVEE